MPLRTASERADIIRIIHNLYPDTKTELDYETPFQLLMAVILSAQTTDKQVNRTTPPLFTHVKIPQDLLNFPYTEAEQILSRVNFYRNKTKFLYGCAKKLVEEFDSVIPEDIRILQTFPGVGVKTAKVVASVLHDAPYVGVDTHIHRVMNRIGFVKTKTPEETDRKLERLLTLEQKYIAHHCLVLFGRYRCTARNPKCSTCPVRGWCNYYQEVFLKSTR